jgi:hypothetical protein
MPFIEERDRYLELVNAFLTQVDDQKSDDFLMNAPQSDVS